MVNIEQRSLRTFQQNPLPVVERVPCHPSRVGRERQQYWGDRLDQIEVLFLVGSTLSPPEPQQGVRTLYTLANRLPRTVKISQVTNPDPSPTKLVLVGWTNASARGTDFLALFRRLLQQLVIGKYEVRAIGEHQSTANLDAPILELLDFRAESLRIEYDAIADDTSHIWVEYA